MTDKTYNDEDIRVFRFRAEVFNCGRLEVRSEQPVPIYNDDGRLLGFAVIVVEGNSVMAECAIDPSNPERLDMETGSRLYWMDADLEYRGFVTVAPLRSRVPTIVWVKSLTLTSKPIEGVAPINKLYGPT